MGTGEGGGRAGSGGSGVNAVFTYVAPRQSASGIAAAHKVTYLRDGLKSHISKGWSQKSSI